MLIHSAVITGSVQLNNTDVSSITNVAGFATTSSVDSLVVKTGSYASTSSLNELQSKTGSYATTSSVNNLQSVTGSYATTSSFGAYTSSNDSTNTTQNTRLSTIESVTGSYATTSSVNNLQSVTGSYATTGSNQFNGNQSISGSITSNGTITAQTLVVQTITSSVDFVTGSSVNGSLSSNTHQFTGSVLITGSNAALLSVNNNVLFVSASGNVLIGTTTGDNYKLQIVGANQATSTFGQTYAGVAAYSQWISSSGAFVMGLDGAAGTTPRITITGTGNVGIGTTSPSAKLDVRGADIYLNISDTIDSRYVNLGNWIAGRTTLEVGGGDLFIKTQTSNYLAFGTLNTERMRITSGGNVGIGTSSPNTLFEVGATTKEGAEYSAYTTNTNGGITSKYSFWRNYTAGSSTPFRASYIGNYNEDDSFNSSNKQHLVFATKSGTAEPVERMRISSTGIVTKPFNPAFRAYYSVNGYWTLAQNDTFVFNTTEYNIGSCYNTSNGRFTAPVAGVYQFNFYTIIYGAYSNGYINFQKNGANLTSGTNIHFTTTVAGVWSNVHYVTSVYLNSGDYISLINRDMSITYHGDDWSSFSGYLVG